MEQALVGPSPKKARSRPLSTVLYERFKNGEGTTHWIWLKNLRDFHTDIKEIVGNGGRPGGSRFDTEVIYENGQRRIGRVLHKKKLTLPLSMIGGVKKGLTVVALRFIGFAPPPNRNIPQHVKNALCGLPCVHCGSKKEVEIDHKCATHSTGTNRYTKKGVSVEHYQCLCRRCNIVKRELYRKAEETGSRAPLANPDAVYGAPEFMGPARSMEDPDWDEGCYWRDIAKFKRWVYTSLARE